jgi:hypothetical protein
MSWALAILIVYGGFLSFILLYSLSQLQLTLSYLRFKEKKEEEITKGFFGEVDYTGSPSKKDQTIILLKSYGAAYHTCREAIRQAGMQMESGDRDGGRLEASIPGTGTGSFGEKILIWVTPMEGGKTKVYVVVDSQLPTQVFDFGRNKLKLGILCSYIR